MIEDTLVSVVVPVYNGEHYLGKTLESALAQSYQPLEVVVVDDGSTDATPEVIAAIAARDSRLRFFRRKNGGVAAARNYGISQARGQLIAMLDADDLWHPQKIALQAAVMNASSPEVGLVYCWPIEIDENDLVIPSAGQIRGRHAFQGRVTSELATENFITTSSVPLIKRSRMEQVGGYDIHLWPQGAEDWKLYLALSEVCEFAVVPEYLVGYRQYSASLSGNVSGMAGSQQGVVRWLTEKWPDLPEEIGRTRSYQMDCYLAATALRNNQFRKALYHRARAHTANPGKLLDPSNFGFLARILVRMAGFTPAKLGPREPRVLFQEFLAARPVKNALGRSSPQALSLPRG